MKYNLILLQHEQTKGMKSFGSKGLLKIKVNSKIDIVINHQLNQISQGLGDFSQLVIVVGFDKEKLLKKVIPENKNVTIVDNHEYKSFNQSYAMMLGLQKINNNYPTLILDSGVILQKPLHINKQELDNNIVFINTKTKEFDVGCTTEGSNIEYMFYDLNPKWVNMFFVAPQNKKEIENLASLHKNSNIFEIINYSLKTCPTRTHSVDGNVYYIKNQKHKLVK